MMIQMNNEQLELYDKLERETNLEEIKKIRERLREISKERDEKLKDCPFAH
jgi:hypothetical protein